jgi:hypothetical protein
MAKAKLELIKFKEFHELLKPDKFKDLLERNVAKAMKAIGLMAEDEVRGDIDKKKWKPNAAMTLQLKPGISTPLRGDPPSVLVQQITSGLVNWDEVHVGVLRDRTVPGRDGKPDYVMSIAAALHKGFTIKVTPKMRIFLAAQGVPIGANTVRMRVPARPFLRAAIKKAMQNKYREQWDRAAQATLAGRNL